MESFEIEGPNPLSERKTRALLKPFLGRHDGIEPIQQAAAALEEALHDRGYAFYLVSVPPQPVDATNIKLRVTPFILKGIRVIGNNNFSEENILRTVPELELGTSPNTKKISKSLRVANVHPKKRLRLRFATDEDGSGIPAQLIVRDTKPWSAFLWGNNTGSEDTGRNRIGLGLQHGNLFGIDHSATVTWTTTPDSEADVNQYGLSYVIPMYRAGGVLSLVAASSDIDTGTVAEVFEVAGKGDAYSAQYTQLFPKIGENYQHRLSIGVEDKLFDNDIDFEGQPIGVDVRSRPASLRYHGVRQGDKVDLEFNAGYFYNLSGGEFNTDEAYAASRSGASSDWSKVRASLAVTARLGNWALKSRLSGQHTDDPLIAGEQLGLTGSTTVRGFSERGLTTDRGLFGTISLTTPSWKNLQFLVFADAARGEIVEPLPDQVQRDTIASAGLGFRWTYKRSLALSVQWAKVVDGGDAGAEDIDTDDDDRFHISLVLRH